MCTVRVPGAICGSVRRGGRGCRTGTLSGGVGSIMLEWRAGWGWVGVAEQVPCSISRGLFSIGILYRCVCPGSGRVSFYRPPTGVTGGLLSKLGGFVIRIRILMYPACILNVLCMYLDVIRSYTSRYTKIHICLDDFEIHVSHHVSVGCIPHVS